MKVMKSTTTMKHSAFMFVFLSIYNLLIVCCVRCQWRSWRRYWAGTPTQTSSPWTGWRWAAPSTCSSPPPTGSSGARRGPRGSTALRLCKVSSSESPATAAQRDSSWSCFCRQQENWHIIWCYHPMTHYFVSTCVFNKTWCLQCPTHLQFPPTHHLEAWHIT